MQKNIVEARSPAGAYAARAASIAASVASVWRCFSATSLLRALAAVMMPTAVSSSRMLPLGMGGGGVGVGGRKDGGSGQDVAFGVGVWGFGMWGGE